MRPVFVGNIGHDARQGELERLFSKYGTVDRVDIKSGQESKYFNHDQVFGYAFVYFEDERDAEDAVRCLDKYPFGYDRRKLSVEWARGEKNKARDAPKGASQRPTKSLFVINFDPIRTRVRDIERHFDPYGKVLNVRVRRNFAFVQFETVEDATKALECTNMSKLLDRVISVEYALRDDDDRDDRDGSLGRGGYGRSPYRRSPSPLYRHSRPSPDYGRGSRGRPSPDYGRPRSPVYDRYDGPAPAYDRHHSPVYDRRRSPVYDRIRSRSPVRR